MALASGRWPALVRMQFRHAAQANRRGALQQVPRSLQGPSKPTIVQLAVAASIFNMFGR